MAEKTKEDKQVVLKKLKFAVGQIVYLITDPLQLKRVVVAINLNPNGYVYELRHCDLDVTSHYDIEISELPEVVVTEDSEDEN